MKHNRYNQAFTIVELMIVVVVLVILVAITAVTYQNMTRSAYNTQVLSGTKSYYDAILAHKTLKGTYPKTQREIDGHWVAMTCLGVGYPDQECGQVNGMTVYEDDAFNTQMRSFLGSVTGPISNVLLPVPGETYIGAVYGIDQVSTSSTGYARVIEYALHGHDVDCQLKGAYSYSTSGGATACEIVFEEISY